ncbi:MAG: S-layer homology domain-containing protein, partial [Chloroflexota bacterium]
STVSGNIARYGGGIYSASNPELINVFVGNNVAFAGGGMYNDGAAVTSDDAALTNVTFSGNWAEQDGGGMVSVNGNPRLENVTFLGNTADNGPGGGLYNFNTKSGIAPMRLTDVTFEGNVALNGGGGMYNDLGDNLALTNITFSGNVSTTTGGGMYNRDGSPTLTNVTFFANTTVTQGGGMYNKGGSPTQKNLTFAYNSANQGGGIYNSTNSNPVILNTILWANPGAGGAQIYNDATSTPMVSDSIIEGGYAGGSFIITADPKLGTFGDHGGFTDTLSILPGSSAIDSGWDADCATTDQREVIRPQGPHCDIGAYEFVATFADVPTDYWAWQFVERLYNYGVTGGCGGGNYCPSQNVTRAQMAVFLLKSKYGTSYSPPPASGAVFGDVPSDHWAAAWIEELYMQSITSGCGNNNFCPDTLVTRDQMAVFLLRAKYGYTYYPPPATGVFADVPAGHWAAPWIEQLASEGITGGCGGGNYCPEGVVSRGQMAVFLVAAFGLP